MKISKFLSVFVLSAVVLLQGCASQQEDAEFQRGLQGNRVVPQQVIIQQQNNNPNACIQDGGGIYCPNHPNTRR